MLHPFSDLLTPTRWTRTAAALSLACAAAFGTLPAQAADSDAVLTETLHAFAVGSGQQGRTPLLQGSDGNLYGVTLGGSGTALRGTVFRLDARARYKTLHEFAGNEVEGGQPGSAPIEGSDGNLYGTTQLGGSSNYGTVYKLDRQGVLTTLHSFVPTNPSAIVSDSWIVQGADGHLYGATRVDGQHDAGSIFRLNTDGSGYTVLHSFTAGAGGREPWGAVLMGADGQLYGTTRFGGDGDCGTIFRLSRTGSFKVLNSLCDGSENQPAYPAADLVQDPDGNLYGTTEFGGAFGDGAVFRRKVDGTVDVLHSFKKGSAAGYGPTARVLRDEAGWLYGVTRFGGEKKQGTAFALAPAGKLTLLHTFSSSKRDGRYPWGPLIQATDGNLYGMTSGGGANTFYGTIYRMVPAP